MISNDINESSRTTLNISRADGVGDMPSAVSS